MDPDMIPARDRQIAAALATGASVAELAAFWGMSEETIRSFAQGAVSTTSTAATFHAAHSRWKPSAAAAEVLDTIGWDLAARAPHAPRCSTRDAALLDMLIAEDVTLAQVGIHFDLTRERVRQIMVKHTGMSTRDLGVYRDQMRDARRVAVGRMRAQRLAETDPTATLTDIMRDSGLTRDEIIDLLGAEEVLARRTPNTWMAKASDDDVLAEMRRVAALPGGTPLTSPFYDDNRADGAIGSVRIIQRHDTWAKACQAAGVAAKKSVRSSYTRRWSEENQVDWALQYVNAVGASATYAGFVIWLRERAHLGAPSAQTVRNTLGGWRDILELVAVRRREVADGAPLSVDLANRATA